MPNPREMGRTNFLDDKEYHKKGHFQGNDHIMKPAKRNISQNIFKNKGKISNVT